MEICHHLLNGVSPKRLLSDDEQLLVKACCEFLERIYDPFLKWRYYARMHRLVPGGSSYNVDPQLHPEIVPFIYTCFEDLVDSKLSTVYLVGPHLLNVLGAITIGSPRNGRLVICPATSNVIIKILSSWSMEGPVRQRALDNANLMLIMLVKSNPVERQIEVDVVIQEYMSAMQNLIRTKDHLGFSEDCQGGEEVANYRDRNALFSLVQNIIILLSEPSTKTSLCKSFLEANLITTLVQIPKQVLGCPVNSGDLLASVVEVIALISHSVNNKLAEDSLKRLFTGLRESSASELELSRIVQQCLSLATSPNDALVLNTMVVKELITWLPTLNDRDQELIIAAHLDVCTRNCNR